jgi:hypothetical protein
MDLQPNNDVRIVTRDSRIPNHTVNNAFRHARNDSRTPVPPGTPAFNNRFNGGHTSPSNTLTDVTPVVTHAQPPNASDRKPSPELDNLLDRIRCSATHARFSLSAPSKNPIQELKEKLSGTQDGNQAVDPADLKRDTEYALLGLRRIRVTDSDTNHPARVNLKPSHADFDKRMMRLLCRFLAPETALATGISVPKRVADSHQKEEDPAEIVGQETRMNTLVPLLMMSHQIAPEAVALLCKMAVANYRDDRKIPDRPKRLELVGALVHAVEENKRCGRNISLSSEDQALIEHMEKQWLATPPRSLPQLVPINMRGRTVEALRLPEFTEWVNRGVEREMPPHIKVLLENAQPKDQLSSAPSDRGEQNKMLEGLKNLLSTTPPPSISVDDTRSEREFALLGLRRILVSDATTDNPTPKPNVLNVDFEVQVMGLFLHHLAPKATPTLQRWQAPSHVISQEASGKNPQKIMREEVRMDILHPLLNVSSSLGREAACTLIKIALDNYRDGRKVGHIPERLTLLGAMLHAVGQTLQTRGEKHSMANDEERKELANMAEQCATTLLILRDGRHLESPECTGALATLREGAQTLLDAPSATDRERRVMSMLIREIDAG